MPPIRDLYDVRQGFGRSFAAPSTTVAGDDPNCRMVGKPRCTAVAVGSIAWFLISSASPRTVSISEAIRGTTEVRLKLRNGARYIRECFGSRWRGFRRRGLPTMAPAHERPAPGRLAAVGPEFE
jgi:hypothetical protein